jgi:hypothetical protein
VENMKNSDENLYFSEDYQEADLKMSVSPNAIGRRCVRCGQYFEIDGAFDKRVTCPECLKRFKARFAVIDEDDSGESL